MNSKLIKFFNTSNVDILCLLQYIKKLQLNNLLLQSLTIWLQYLSNPLTTSMSIVIISPLPPISKLRHIFHDSLGGVWMLGTVTSSSHQEDQVVSAVFVYLLALSLCWSDGLLILPCCLGNWRVVPVRILHSHVCTPAPCVGHLSWGMKSTETKRCHNWGPLSDSAIGVHYGDQVLLCSIGAAWSECSLWGERSKANLSLSLPIQGTHGVLIAGKVALPSITGWQIGVSPLCMADTGTHIL